MNGQNVGLGSGQLTRADVPQPQRAPMLMLAIEGLHEDVSRISHVAEELVQRLAPVLRIEPENPNKDGGMPASGVKAVDSINEARMRLNVACSALANAFKRVEV